MKFSAQKRRLQKVIENDRTGITEASVYVISKDLEEVLQNYFTLKDSVKVKIEVNADGYSVSASVKADGFKAFACTDEL